jgi:two-component system NtrC family sensor kinase
VSDPARLQGPRPSRPPDDLEPLQSRLLLVDDDPLVGAILGRLLSPFRVTFAQSAAGALARLQAGGQFDAVLCDIYMPGMDGIQFHAEVAKVSPALAGRIIFMSASASRPEAARFLERTGNTCLHKPMDHGALKLALLAAAQTSASATLSEDGTRSRPT